MSRYLPVLLIGLILGGLLVAQVSTGTISGVVQDPSGATIPGATVTIKNVDTGTARALTSDSGGRYTAPDLAPGNYEVQAQISGFQTEVRTGIELTVGRQEVVNLALKVGQISDRVTITEAAPLVESTTSAMSSLVDARTIRDLPLNGRSYTDLALLQPGVVSMGAGQAPAAFDFGEGTRFSVGGSRPYANSFMLDGTDINDHANGTPGGSAGTNLGVDGVQEFKINTSVSPAEYGRSSGGVIAAITRSGTNSVHGSAFEFLRNNALDSPGYFDDVTHGGTGTIAPYKRNQYGGSLGGRIKKDKTFFFGTYEALRLRNGASAVNPVVPTAETKAGRGPACASQPGGVCYINPVVLPFLDLFQTPNGTINTDGTGVYVFAPTQATDEKYFMTRVDHQINDKMRLFVRYSFDKDSKVIPNFNGSAVANEQDVSRRQYSTIQLNNILRPTLVNSLRVSYNRTFQNFDDVISDPRAASLSFIPGEHFGTISFGSQGLSTSPLNFLGVDNGAPREYWTNLFQEGDDLTYIKGRHTVKMGVNVTRMDDNVISTGNTRGDYTFLDIPNFLAGTPFRFDAPPPGSEGYRGLRQTMFGVYTQDDFKVTQRFTLNLGLRYEAVSNPREVNGKMANLLNLTDPLPTVLKDSYFSITKKDIQPRVGFAWQLDGSGKTVVRAGAGIFHDHILPFSYTALATGTPPFFSTLSDQAYPVPFPKDTNLTNGPPPPLQFNRVPAVNKEPAKISYNLTLQQEVMKNTVLEVAYIASESHHLQRNGEFNPPALLSPGVFPVPGKGQSPQDFRINRAFGSITAQAWNTNANYNALQVTLKRRSASGLQYQVFYTYSKSIDDKSSIAGGETRQEPNTGLDFLDWRRDRGRSSFDARQNLVFTTTYPIPFKFQHKAVGAILGGWELNGISTFRTGEPFTARMGSNVSQNGDRWSPDRPNLNPAFVGADITSGVTAGCTLGGVKIPAGQPLGTPDRWFDPCAFSPAAPGTFGNVGRNTITGPGLVSVDASLNKVFKPSERINVQLRAEVFNLLDHANFYEPIYNVFSGGGARYSSSAGNISQLISSPGGRLIQLGLKVTF
jgi:hypothetical protein